MENRMMIAGNIKYRYGGVRAVVILSMVYGSILHTPCVQGQSKPEKLITADITTHAGDQARFIEGSGVSLFVSLNQDAYVFLVHENETKVRTLLYPADPRSDLRQDAGNYLPLKNFTTSLRVSPPFGRETITMLVSDRAFPSLPTTSSRTLRTLSWPDEQWQAWLKTYPKQCGCQFVIDQVSFVTFSENEKK